LDSDTLVLCLKGKHGWNRSQSGKKKENKKNVIKTQKKETIVLRGRGGTTAQEAHILSQNRRPECPKSRYIRKKREYNEKPNTYDTLPVKNKKLLKKKRST